MSAIIANRLYPSLSKLKSMKRKPANPKLEEEEEAGVVSENSSEGEGWKVEVNSSDEENGVEGVEEEDEDGDRQPSAAAAVTTAAATDDTNKTTTLRAIRTTIMVEEEPTIIKSKDPGEKEEDEDGGYHIVLEEETVNNQQNDAKRLKYRLSRTGAAEDWKKHTMSFRVRGEGFDGFSSLTFFSPFQKRLQASRRLDYVHLAQAVHNQMHLSHEFEQIPENRVSLV